MRLPSCFHGKFWWREWFWSAAVVLIFAPFLIPGSAFFAVNSLTYDHETKRMVQDRTTPLWTISADWTAELSRLESGQWVKVCNGGDRAPYRPGRLAQPMTIDVWTGDDGCEARLTPGDTYRGSASWTMRFLIWSWTATAESAPFTWP